MSQFDELCNEVQANTEQLKIFKRKLWLFEWFLLFLMLYMCYIAYNLYELNVEIVGSQVFTPDTKILCP